MAALGIPGALRLAALLLLLVPLELVDDVELRVVLVGQGHLVARREAAPRHRLQQLLGVGQRLARRHVLAELLVMWLSVIGGTQINIRNTNINFFYFVKSFCGSLLGLTVSLMVLFVIFRRHKKLPARIMHYAKIVFFIFLGISLGSVLWKIFIPGTDVDSIHRKLFIEIVVSFLAGDIASRTILKKSDSQGIKKNG